jgi:prepilin-type N-terminal cleavage/methylation domain-containing protein
MDRPSRIPRANERGFTLVETLVVVLIVAILASVALALFLNQRTKAQDAEAKTTAGVATRALVIWHQDHGSFSGAGIEQLARIEPTLANARGLVVATTATSYRVSVDSAAGPLGGGPFEVDHRAGTTERTCTGPGRGGCPDGGVW